MMLCADQKEIIFRHELTLYDNERVSYEIVWFNLKTLLGLFQAKGRSSASNYPS